MNKSIKKFCYLILIIFFVLGNFIAVQAISKLSDTVKYTWPGGASDHIIKFLNNVAIPPSGKIVIEPEAGKFQLLNGFDFTDVDIATSSDINGPYTNRDLAALPSDTIDGVAAISSSTNDSITITLNSSFGINAGDFVIIKLGTSAEYGVNGTRVILNPSDEGSYDVQIWTQDPTGELIKHGDLKVGIIEPVRTNISVNKLRSNGTPTGVLSFGTHSTIMSLMSNYKAYCRYTTASGSPWLAMPDQFDITGEYYHAINLTGLINGRSYEYHIRCRDLYNIDDTEDYVIAFSISGQEGASGDESGRPGSGGGGSGGGSGGGGGNTNGAGQGPMLPYPPPPGNPSVSLQGWAYPGSQVVLLKDSKEEKKITATNNSEFQFSLYSLTQGVYTFGLWAQDQNKRRSNTQSYTIWIKEGTKSDLSQIFMPPTVAVKNSSVSAGDSFEVSGQTINSGSVEIWLYPKQDGALQDSQIIKKTVTADVNGNWSALVDTNELAKGQYFLKARGNTKTLGNSEFSQSVNVAIGTNVTTSGCPGADLNKDGKVNITDFSILLYYWNSNNTCADQNGSGKVDLVDFSIMMFYWTG